MIHWSLQRAHYPEGPLIGQMAVESAKIQQALEGDRQFGISCELGLRGQLASGIWATPTLHWLPVCG